MKTAFNGRGFHEKAGLCQGKNAGVSGGLPLAEFDAAPHARSALFPTFVLGCTPTDGAARFAGGTERRMLY